MIFEQEQISVNILSILELKWEKGENDTHSSHRPFHALSYRVTGDADFLSPRGKTHVSKGEIAYVPAGFAYEMRTSAERLYVIHFEAESLHSPDMEVFRPLHTGVFKDLFASAFQIWHQKKPGYKHNATAAFYKILEQMQLQHTHRLSAGNRIDYAVEYLHSHFTDSSLTVAKLAEIAGISEVHFRSLFYKAFGVSPLRYINNLRMDYAKELLLSGYYRVGQVAEQCGFSDSKYFSTKFKHITGVSPSEMQMKNG